MSTTTGVILAGGKATRMGRDRALVQFRGAPMIRQVATALEDAGLGILVVGRTSSIGGLTAIPDAAAIGGGPAAGLLTALRRKEVKDVFMVAVDQPLLRPATIIALLDLPGDIVVPVADGHPQVTCAVYRSGCLGRLEDMNSSGERKLRRLLDRVDTTRVDKHLWSSWGEEGHSWMSLDTPEAVREAEALL